jgi:uncharacterized protein (UPF0335 family)
MKRTKVFVAILLCLGLMTPAFSFAQSSSVTDLQAQINALLAKINDLKTQVQTVEAQKKAIKTQAESIQVEAKNIRTLVKGMSGDDVKELQAWLAQDKDVYPQGLISGFYGPMTEQAVKKFQKKYGIEQAGSVGPKTRAQLNKLFKKMDKEIAKGISESMKKNDDDEDDDEDDDDDKHGKKVVVCHKPVGTLGVTISISKNALNAHLAHGDFVGACSGNSNASTTPDKIAPVISNVAIVPSVTTAQVTWTTNENSDSKVYFATSTPILGNSSFGTAGNLSLVTNHTVSLTGLVPSTTYYYHVVSKDASGNSATSSVYSFNTGAMDTQAPLIHTVGTNPQVGKANITWITSEAANSRVWYSTSSDVMNSSSKATVFNSTLVTSHNLELTGLTQGTTYYFLITSTDGAGNTATSTSNLYTFNTQNLSITSLSAVPTANSATVTWTTNVQSDSRTYYSTSTPVMSGSPLYVVNDATLTTSHSQNLSSLTASTTYYYLSVSKDAYGNTATSSTQTFTTL